MFAVIARHFDPHSNQPRSVRLEAVQGGLRLHATTESLPIPLGNFSLSDRVNGEPRLLHLPDGSVCEVDDLNTLDTILGEATKKAKKTWWRLSVGKYWQFLVLAFLLVGCLATIAYRAGLSNFSASMAARLPGHWVRAASDRALARLDKHWLQPSQLSIERQAQLRNKFAALHPPPEGAPPYRLEFRQGDQIGAKTFSLPSGDIIITDEMVQLARSDTQILALLAYELGHVRHKDALQLAMRNNAATATLMSYLIDSGTGAAALAEDLLDTFYSLENEHRADLYAISMLQANALPTDALVDVLALQAQWVQFPDVDIPCLVASSHFLNQRIETLREGL